MWRNTQCSKRMVFLWLVGDIGKVVYFVMLEQPVQFWICGILQVTIDIVILGQVPSNFCAWLELFSK